MSFSFQSISLFLLILSLLLLMISTAAAAQRRSSNIITLGSSLTPNSTWPSPSAVFAFGFFPQNDDAYAVGVFLPDKTVVWTANTDTDPTVPKDGASLHLTTDGRLILRWSQGQDVDLIPLLSTTAIASASMLDTGNFVLYDSASTIIWQSFDYPTNTLLPGQRLPPGRQLFSSASETDYATGIFRLKMQTDGNLVQYPVNTEDSPTYGSYSLGRVFPGGNVSLNLDNDGRLYLLNGSAPLYNITTGGGGGGGGGLESLSLMRLDVGGIFRMYSLSLNPLGNLTQRWSLTNDTCAPKGLCGFNAFCIRKEDNVPECQCLPGFEFVQSGNNTAGCSRSSSAQGCPNIDSKLKFEIRAVYNTEWFENSYENLNTSSEEECRKFCLDDCSCEAAFFKDGRCRKQRLPLRYGRKSLNDSNTALIRISTTKAPDAVTEHVDFLIIGIVLMSVGVLALTVSAILALRKRRDCNKISHKDGEANLVEGVTLQAFTFEHLSKATNDFKEVLGRGASGIVYKGVLQNSQKPVAVKRIEREVERGEREFQTELRTIGKMYHRNLVRLLGYCIDGANKLLVLEYMSNGSLADLLFKHENRPNWEERIKIARDIARGILYLHQECETQIIHCDIKPQNILMDENGCAKISDFGMAKLLKQDQTHTYTGKRGTRGYVAPEWDKKQAITVKADVYSFGVMLMEIICCRRCVDWSLSEEEQVLEKWVYKCYAKGEIGVVVGEEILEERKVERMVKIGIWCVQHDPSLRPTMQNVLLMLEGTIDIPIPPSLTSFLSSMS